MAISRLATRTNNITALNGTVDDAEFDNIIDELNAHTAAADPHTSYLLKTGGTLSGALTISVASNSAGESITTSSTTNNIFAITGDSLTTGTLGYLYSNSADVSDRNLLYIYNDNALAVLTTCLKLRQDATMTAGSGVLEIYNGATLNLYIPETGVVYGKGFII